MGSSGVDRPHRHPTSTARNSIHGVPNKGFQPQSFILLEIKGKIENVVGRIVERLERAESVFRSTGKRRVIS